MEKLPGLDCGLCGYPTCKELSEKLIETPDLLKRCIPLSKDKHTCNDCTVNCVEKHSPEIQWKDSLGRDVDFYLDSFPNDPGPSEIIIPHNPMLTREMDIKVGDILIGRPLGMSCGCPVTHCGIATEVDHRTGVMTWQVVGPLVARDNKCKDLGYYIAEGYEGIATESRVDIKIGMRYYFLPKRCSLQWRHSGLVNFINKTSDGLRIRIEGLWIG